MRTLVDSIQPDKQAIRRGVERRLRSRIFEDILSKETGSPLSTIARWRWGAVCTAVFVLSFVVYTTFYSGETKNYFLLPIGQAQLAECGKVVSEFSQIDAEGETIKTNAGGMASLYQSNGYRVRIARLSSLQVVDDASVRLDEGSLFAEVEKRTNPKKPFSVAAGDVKVYVLGTQFSVEKNSDNVVVAVKEGKVRVVANDGEEKILEAGETVSFQQGKIGMPNKISVDRIAVWRSPLIQAEKKLSANRKFNEKIFSEPNVSRLYLECCAWLIL